MKTLVKAAGLRARDLNSGLRNAKHGCQQHGHNVLSVLKFSLPGCSAV
jgi:hypothetical protein